jgi:hypothetical protein
MSDTYTTEHAEWVFKNFESFEFETVEWDLQDFDNVKFKWREKKYMILIFGDLRISGINYIWSVVLLYVYETSLLKSSLLEDFSANEHM